MALFFSFALGLVESLPPPNYTEQIQQEQNTLENVGTKFNAQIDSHNAFCVGYIWSLTIESILIIY